MIEKLLGFILRLVFLSLLQKRMRVKRLPTILALHLKRFKYMEQYNRHIKVSHRVVFPLELRLFNTVSSFIRKSSVFAPEKEVIKHHADRH